MTITKLCRLFRVQESLLSILMEIWSRENHSTPWLSLTLLLFRLMTIVNYLHRLMMAHLTTSMSRLRWKMVRILSTLNFNTGSRPSTMTSSLRTLSSSKSNSQVTSLMLMIKRSERFNRLLTKLKTILSMKPLKNKM